MTPAVRLPIGPTILTGQTPLTAHRPTAPFAIGSVATTNSHPVVGVIPKMQGTLPNSGSEMSGIASLTLRMPHRGIAAPLVFFK